ncbi:MAG: GntR family transcriptional regulator [Ruminiclostridium sp.]|nr:GntR family transcriptional regulator [Ruminiclostridium sp.]
MFDIRIEGKAPIYEQLYEKISGLITSGILAAGERLPTVRETARSLGINPNTVQRAYNRLEQEGFIYSIPAKGSYVSDNRSASDAKLKKASDELKQSMVSAKNAGLGKDAAKKLVEEIW